MKKLTLKEFLEFNSIKATSNDRSKIGILLSFYQTKDYKEEDNGKVKLYSESFLNDDTTIIIIMNYFNSNN
jgi:hypothetical protein